MFRALRQQLVLVIFTLSYVGAFSIFAFSRGDPQALVYLVVMVLGMLLVAKVHSRSALSRGVLWGLSVWGLMHMAGGLIHVGGGVLYGRQITSFVRFDQAVHVFGFGYGTLAAWQSLRPKLAPGYRKGVGLAVIVALAGMGVGAMNEVIEFFATLVLPATNVGGYRNTGFDLVSNMIGAILAAVWVIASSDERPESS